MARACDAGGDVWGRILVLLSPASATYKQGPPALRHRRRALFSPHSNGYINIISPASCPVTDGLMTRRSARAALGKDTHRVQGLAWAGVSLGAGRARQSPPGGVRGTFEGSKRSASPRGLRLSSAPVLLGARNPSLRQTPIFRGARGRACAVPQGPCWIRVPAPERSYPGRLSLQLSSRR